MAVAQSSVTSLYLNLQPGLCGRLECPRVCSRVCHCEAGLRRSRALLAQQAQRRYAVHLDRSRAQRCERIRKAGGCPTVCNSVGGCFLPQPYDHPSEARRKVFRAQRAIDQLVSPGGAR